MIVDLDSLRNVQRFLRKLESAPLEDIRWILNGEELEVDQKDIDDWKYTGLGNKHFALNYLISG